MSHESERLVQMAPATKQHRRHGGACSNHAFYKDHPSPAKGVQVIQRQSDHITHVRHQCGTMH